jgi:hypothetical protein
MEEPHLPFLRGILVALLATLIIIGVLGLGTYLHEASAQAGDPAQSAPEKP